MTANKTNQAELARAADEGLSVTLTDDYSNFTGVVTGYRDVSDAVYLRGYNNLSNVSIFNASQYELLVHELTPLEKYQALRVGAWFTVESTGPVKYVKVDNDRFVSTDNGQLYATRALGIADPLTEFIIP